jgi:hypothetical protein
MATAKSTSLQAYAHSLSYQATTFTKAADEFLTPKGRELPIDH